jgi:hypothetical protein
VNSTDPPSSDRPSPVDSASVSALRSIPNLKRCVVAVHGIGDQFENATIQSVVSAFGGFFNYPAGVPLGAFRKPRPPIQPFFLETPETAEALPVPRDLAETAFIEIYWADIPREQQKGGYTIEETKAWARTVVARLRARYAGFTAAKSVAQRVSQQDRQPLPVLAPKDYRAAADAIEEMIESFAVLDNLLWIAEKAGLMKFNLDQLLTAYVGDVQIVADFEQFRGDILGRFQEVLQAIGDQIAEGKDLEIYIVAHSEGTVVAFMGLLQAMCAIKPPEWFKSVRGFMTFGSPIDKHIVLWPDIWKPVALPQSDVTKFYQADPSKKIWWKNYYDYGDPVGFQLDTTRDWMRDHEWMADIDKKKQTGVFDFDEKLDDHGFSRYPLPGEAHNDYWKDPKVFGHFIQNVMKLQCGDNKRFAEPPKTRLSAAIFAHTVPYLLVYVLCCAATYFIYRATEDYIGSAAPSLFDYLINVLGMGALLAGMTALARIPKLTRRIFWLIMSILIFAICASGYYFVSPEVQKWQAFELFKRFNNPHVSGYFVMSIAFLIALFAAWIGRIDPRRWKQGWTAKLAFFGKGAQPLIFIGLLQVVAMVVYRIYAGEKVGLPSGKSSSLWPLILAGGAFLYLWWLAILIFDLVFVWHRYIRWAVAPNALRAMRHARKEDEMSGRKTAVQTTANS